MKIFVSYTSTDRRWAHWIAWQLREAGHEPFVHEWEIGAGENIPRWMEERIDQADHLIGVFSDTYCKAIFSRSERWAAYWDDPEGRVGFLIPIEVVKVTKWPRLVNPLNRLSLTGLNESDAADRLKAFLEPRKPPSEKPVFPGISANPSEPAFTDNSESLGADAPNFPAASLIVEQLANGAVPIASITDLDRGIRCIEDHEPQPQIFGRDDEVETIVSALLAEKMILVAGGPGMGKTAVATAALYDARIISQFRRRRIFASLETSTDARAILAKLVEELGLPPTGDEVSLLRILEANATEKPLAAVLDNAETVFDADRVAAERLLNLVAQIEGLSVVVTIRGVPPHVPSALQIDNLAQLDANSARDAFISVAGEAFVSDTDLPHLLEALDGHALSIRLVAAQAIGSPSLKGLRESWDEAHSEILRISGEEESRLTSVRASLALSLSSKRMRSTPLARRLMALLAFLPGGLAETDVHSLLGDRGALPKAKANEAVVCLHQLRLVERRIDHRLRMLTPLRECVKSTVPLIETDRTRLIERYLNLASKARKIGEKSWDEVRVLAETEADNLDPVCDLAVATNISHGHLEQALTGLADFHAVAGKGAIQSIFHAAVRLRLKPPSQRLANCIFMIGRNAERHSDDVTAITYFREALALYQEIGDVLGQANCIHSEGSIEAGRFHHEIAIASLEEAISLYRRKKNILGEANGRQQLASISLRRRDFSGALVQIEEALALFKKLGAVMGTSGCAHMLGQIACMRSCHEEALTRFGESLTLERRIGHVLGEANCIRACAEIEHERANYEVALAQLERVAIKAGYIRSDGRSWCILQG